MSLLVIGGGPAGAAAAITARQAGMPVTLVEAARGPRFRPGETLHPGVEPILETLGARAAVMAGSYLRHAGTWVQWGTTSEFVPFGSDASGTWRGFQVPRADFDQRLLNVAGALGTHVCQGVSARSVITSKSRVVGVATSKGAFRAEHVIDASGCTHWLARQLSVPMVRESARLLARYGYVSARRLERVPIIRADRDGWTWVAQLSNDQYGWVRVATPERMAPGHWLPNELTGGRTLFTGRADVTWRMPAQTAGEGWFICGDAAIVLDPSSSHGVLRGLMTGMAAARCAIKSSGVSGVSRRVANGYDRWLRDWFGHDSRVMSDHYHSIGLFGY